MPCRAYHLLILTTLSSSSILSSTEAKSLNPSEHILRNCEGLTKQELFACINNFKQSVNKRQVDTDRDLQSCLHMRKKCTMECFQHADCIKNCSSCPEINLITNESSSLNPQNVTTFIKLINVINNTNVVDLPMTINATNLNNVHIHHNDTSLNDKYSECCTIVEPKNCKLSGKSILCQHIRRKTCGFDCTSSIMHGIPRKMCDLPNECKTQLFYIPQPQKPRCIYQRYWPFVSCGQTGSQNCDGCYDHYYSGFTPNYEYMHHCSMCYDDAFDFGPVYRRGPVFQSFHFHQISCYFSGSCNIPPFCNIYGCMKLNIMPFHTKSFDYYSEYNENIYPIDYLNDLENEGLAKNSDWQIESIKCRIFGDDGKSKIKNCTEDDIRKNQFAYSPLLLTGKNDVEIHNIQHDSYKRSEINNKRIHRSEKQGLADNFAHYHSRKLHNRHISKKAKIIYDN